MGTRCIAFGKMVARRAFPKAVGKPRVARAFACRASDQLADVVRAKNAENPIMLYSKTYCPFCREVKILFNDLGVEAKVVELDELEDGPAVQEALQEVSGMRTVPQVFVGGELVGGCDDTYVQEEEERKGKERKKMGGDVSTRD